jgi:hypothetical protein
MRFTPWQTVVLDLLADGKNHLRSELLTTLEDPYAGKDLLIRRLNKNLVDLRDRLRPNGHDIVCTLVNRRVAYRHVRLLDSGD